MENSQNVLMSSGIVPNTQGNSLDAFKRLKTGKSSVIPTCSPISSTKEIIDSNVNIGNIANNTCVYMNNNRGGTGNRGTNPQPSQQIPDPRFRSQSFREAVQVCLLSLGLPLTFGNFKRFDKAHKSETPIDWLAYAHNLLEPVFGMVKCFILNARGEKIADRYILCEVRAHTEQEAIKIVHSRGYAFGGLVSDTEFTRELRKKGGELVVRSLPENKINLVIG